MQNLLHTRWFKHFGKVCQRRWLTQSCTQGRVSIGVFDKVMQCFNISILILLSGFGIDK